MSTVLCVQNYSLGNNLQLHYKQSSEEKILATIYKNYYKKVFAFVINKVKNTVVAQDLTQECFVKAHISWHTLRQKGSLQSWLFSIANNLCLNYFKKVKQERKSVESGDIELRLNLKESSEDLKEFFFAILDKYFPLIKPEDQQLLNAKYIEQKSYEELSTQLELSTSALKMKIKRAKEQIYALALPEIKQQFSY